MSRKNILPRKLLWRLTVTNIIVITIFVMISGYAIYNTACFLVGDLGPLRESTQGQFNRTLFQYLIYFSLATIILASIVHIYLTKVLLKPLQQLIDSTKVMKAGRYPDKVAVTSHDEIGQLTKHFNELMEKIETNEQYRKKFVADLSHELKTPLTNLNGYFKGMKDGVIVGDQVLYHALYEELQRITKLIEQLEQLKKWDYEKADHLQDCQDVSVEELVEQSVNLFRLRLKEQGLDIDIHIEAETIMVHEASMLQVLNNVIDNAIRYYKGTGPIEITGNVKNEVYHLAVSGPSEIIPPDDQAMIFERFYRVDPSRAKETGGAGLGLAISKEIIEHHEGSISLDVEGDKHIFTMTLPLLIKASI